MIPNRLGSVLCVSFKSDVGYSLFDALVMTIWSKPKLNYHQHYKHQILESAMKNLKQLNRKAIILGRRMEGRILPPLILWMLGVPGGIVLLLWIFFFRD